MSLEYSTKKILVWGSIKEFGEQVKVKFEHISLQNVLWNNNNCLKANIQGNKILQVAPY